MAIFSLPQKIKNLYEKNYRKEEGKSQ